MFDTVNFLDKCLDLNFDFLTGTPCSYLKPLINSALTHPDINFIEAANEGDAVALASGAWLAGKRPMVMFQNSGLGNAVNPITSLSYTFQIPFLGITTLRGQPGGPKDEPQHELMGAITCELLELMKVPWSFLPEKEEDLGQALNLALQTMEETRLPYFFVIKKNDFAPFELKQKSASVDQAYIQPEFKKLEMVPASERVTRTEALKSIQTLAGHDAIIYASTGKTGRELYQLDDLENQLYMVGSMGCVGTLAMGTALCQNQKVIAIDGDGALMMRMSTLATEGIFRPKNLIHILLDNGTHDSTGGQATRSEHIDFAAVAKACGFLSIYQCSTLDNFEISLNEALTKNELTFIDFKIKPGSPKDLVRPSVHPREVALRVKNFMKRLR